jgi:hypothetical protein
MRVTLPLLCYHSLYISPEFFLLPSCLPPPPASSSCISLLRGCVWCDFPRGGQARGSYGWAVHFPHPSLIPEEPSTYQPTSNLFRASEPLLVLWASEVQIRYWFSVEVNATFPGAFHHLSSTIVVSFSAYPLSAVLQYIYS